MGRVTRTVTLKLWRCERCGHEWKSETQKKPLRCAKCKTPYWDRPKSEEAEGLDRSQAAEVA